MLPDLYRRLEKIPPVKRHWAYAVACFQHAMGISTPIIKPVRKWADDDGSASSLINYVTLSPGTSGAKMAGIKDISSQQVRNLVVAGCAEEGLIDQGRNVTARDDCSTLALYFNDQLGDFHFAVGTQKGFEDTVPCQDRRTYTSLPRQINGYVLDRIYLKPKELVPMELARIGTIAQTMTTPHGDIPFLQPTATGVRMNGRILVLHPDQDRAILVGKKSNEAPIALPFPASGPPLI